MKSDSVNLRTLIAYANTAGGKLIIGVEDTTKEIVGVNPDKQSQIIDRITNALADSVSPQIIPSITSVVVDRKTIIIAEVFSGPARPYYFTALGPEAGTYVRINATTRHADEIMLKELQLQGLKKSYDEIVLSDRELDVEAVNALCEAMEQHRDASAGARGETVARKDITLANLENWNIVKRDGNKLLPTIAFDLLTANSQRYARIQCGLFKGTEKVVFIDKREFDGPVYEQIDCRQPGYHYR